MTLYARKIVLRNCGHFTVIQSDFGADYRTHTHVTGEALYASLTRGATWNPKAITVKQDTYDFGRDYDLQAMLIWFTPGIFLAPNGMYHFAQDALDTTYFNVLHEVYPTTRKSYGFDRKSGELKQKNRPHHTPTYGTWQSIKPNNQFTTFAYSQDTILLNSFAVGQTFMLGKKRTMVQVMRADELLAGELKTGSCLTPFLQVSTSGMSLFQSFEIIAATARYLLIRGQTQPDVTYVRFGGELAIPDFAIPTQLLGISVP